MKANKQIIVSIIIPTYKRTADLVRLLDSIVKSNFPKDNMEIIVVDNAGDVAPKIIQRFTKHIMLRLAKTDDNLFCSGGRQYGSSLASGQYLFFIDDDNILAPDCIRLLADSLDNSPSLGVVAPLMLFFNDKKRIWAAGVRLTKLGLPRYLHAGERITDVKLPETIYGAECFPNAFMVRREVFRKVPFDVANFPHNWSEADFGLRLKMHGYVSATNTKAHEWHDIDYDGQLTRTDEVKIYDQAKSRILFRKRFFDSTSNHLLFWTVTFPISSIFYLKAIVSSPDKNKLAMAAEYIKGTFDGIRTSITKDVRNVHTTLL